MQSRDSQAAHRCHPDYSRIHSAQRQGIFFQADFWSSKRTLLFRRSQGIIHSISSFSFRSLVQCRYRAVWDAVACPFYPAVSCGSTCPKSRRGMVHREFPDIQGKVSGMSFVHQLCLFFCSKILPDFFRREKSHCILPEGHKHLGRKGIGNRNGSTPLFTGRKVHFICLGFRHRMIVDVCSFPALRCDQP